MCKIKKKKNILFNMYDGEKILWLTFLNFLCFHSKLIKYYRIIYHLSGVLTETGYYRFNTLQGYDNIIRRKK